MSSSLAVIPVDRRRQLARALGLFAVLFLAVGGVAATGATGVWLTLFVVVALGIGLLLGLLCWGVAASVRADLADVADGELDAAVQDALARAPAAVRARFTCGCGQQHDSDEMHIVDAEPSAPPTACAGEACTHTCETCVLATLHPSRSGRAST